MITILEYVAPALVSLASHLLFAKLSQKIVERQLKAMRKEAPFLNIEAQYLIPSYETLQQTFTFKEMAFEKINELREKYAKDSINLNRYCTLMGFIYGLTGSDEILREMVERGCITEDEAKNIRERLELLIYGKK